MEAKRFSLRELVNDLIEGLPGAELSWDFKLDATRSHFTIRIPIKLYGDRKDYVRERVLNSARKFGFEVSSLFMKSDHDLMLERDFSDITAEPFAQKR